MNVIRFVTGAIAAFVILGCQELTQTPQADSALKIATPQSAMPADMPFGTASDINYANRLWQVLRAEKVVGPDALPQEPFFGGAKPHGMILEITSQTISLADHRGFAVVKKNYNGAGVSVTEVKQDRGRYLESITVMYRREAGYDNDNQNWFWVKYRPDGTLFEKTMDSRVFLLAGRLMKGATPDENQGCIYCHSSAGGGDYVFYPNVLVP